MRITYLNVSAQMGGTETSLLELLAGIRVTQPEWPLHVILGESGPLAAKVQALGATTKILLLPPRLALLGESDLAVGRRSGLDRLRKAWEIARALPEVLEYASLLSDLLCSLKPDIIHASGLKMHLLSALAAPSHTALIWHIHDYLGARPFTRRLFSWKSGLCSVIIANSKSVQRDVARCCPKHGNIIPIYNAINLERFSPSGPQIDLDKASGLSPASPGTVRIGLLATFATWKGHSLFLDAISRLPTQMPIRAYIIGGPIYQTAGSQRSVADLMDEVRQLGMEDRVGLTDFVDAPESALRSLDIVVHASTLPEPFGMVIVEAMACGKAVVASKSSGAAEIFSDGHDVLAYTCGSAEELAEKLNTLLTNPLLRGEIAEAGLKSVQKFHRSRLGSELAEIYFRVSFPALA